MSMTENEYAAEFKLFPSDVAIIGSTLICGRGNDIDVLCYCPSENYLNDFGFHEDTDIIYETPLRSWRRGEINAIVVTEKHVFTSELTIAYAASVLMRQTFDMSERDDRVLFHSTVRAMVMDKLNHKSPIL